jgi:acyl-CoA thioesterase-1
VTIGCGRVLGVAAVALSSLTLLSGCTGALWGDAGSRDPGAVAALGAPWSLPSTAPVPAQTIVTIGDSIMSGNGVQPDEAWPAVLADANGWQLTNLAEDGAGFVQKGDDGHTFAEQVAEAASIPDAPALIVVSASSNDLGRNPAKVEHSAKKAFLALRQAFPQTSIVGISALWGDERPPDELAPINDGVHDAAVAEGAGWVDIGEPLAGRIDLMQFDDTHPTSDGQQVVAAVVDSRLRALLGS